MRALGWPSLSFRQAFSTAALVMIGAPLVGCSLVLGIDDVPPAPSKTITSDAGHDANPVDAKPDRAIEAGAADGSDSSERHDAGTDTGAPGQVPPRGGTQTSSTAEINLAVHHLWLGDTPKDTTFAPNASAWASFGYNIDGKVTTSASTDVCSLFPGTSTSLQTDGNDGADNSFGENLVTDLSFAFGGFSEQFTQEIEDGDFTLLIDTTGLSTDVTQTNVGLTTQLFGGGPFNGTPTFTKADDWPVDPTSLANGSTLANGARTSLSDSYVTNGTWVSGQPVDLFFIVQIGGQPFPLTIHEAVMTFDHSVDDAGSHAANGTVAGVLKPTEFIAAVKRAAAGYGDGTYCGEVGAFVSRVMASQDIMEDGSNQAGESCNGVSVALAFTADQIMPPSSVSPSTSADASTPVCPGDAGG
jgi:hypothetical protein